MSTRPGAKGRSREPKTHIRFQERTWNALKPLRLRGFRAPRVRGSLSLDSSMISVEPKL